ncbi:TPA: hypothetical protein N0F65_009478, partial [Lagenidium giganteum]
MRMTMARKCLLEHIEVVKPENEKTSEWRTNDMKAFAIIAQGFEIEHQSKIRNAHSALEAWQTLPIGDAMDEARQLVIMLGSLPSSYDMIVSIIENARDVALIDVKEKLLKEYEKLESSEKADE